MSGVLERSRTSDLALRTGLLYPTELREQMVSIVAQKRLFEANSIEVGQNSCIAQIS